MLRPIIPNREQAARLSAIEREAFEGREDPWSVDKYVRFAANPGASIIADTDLESGLVIVRCAADEAEIVNLAVVPLVQRSGLGRKLMQAAETFAAGNGATRMFLEVALDNIPARQLYARLGYTMVGRRRGYYKRAGGSRMDALILFKSLAE